MNIPKQKCLVSKDFSHSPQFGFPPIWNPESLYFIHSVMNILLKEKQSLHIFCQIFSPSVTDGLCAFPNHYPPVSSKASVIISCHIE
jgi:hypothetical protein